MYCMHRYRFDAYPDPEPTFHFDGYPDPDIDRYPSFTNVRQSNFFYIY
jgi:hypothetical protein